MPPRNQRQRRSKPKALPRLGKMRRAIMFNPQPVFTETFKLGSDDPLRPYYQLDSNAGGVLSVRISQVPQLAQYSALYTKYKILKAKFICLPQFNTSSSDVNTGAYNAFSGVNGWGMSRLVTSVQDSPSQVVPLNEDDVLEDNGCKIHSGKSKIVLSCRPVPDLLDANNVKLNLARKFINFSTGAPDVTHYGIRWWHSLPVNAGNTTSVPYFVYCKLTFQLADPR